MRAEWFVGRAADCIVRTDDAMVSRKNCKVTYAGGRFMDLDRNATGIYEVDFNRAYVPYCYYNPTFECPLPPKENRLTIPVRAGERLKSQK